jgi:tetratricopeptide (TPR) repeat protein
MLVHVGTALPVLGENRQSELLEMLPKNTAYVGVGVGRRWAQSFMRQAAGKTGGYFTQINPDEEVAWRAFELSSVLNTPRLLDVAVEADGMAFLNFADTVVHGEQICAVGRIAEGEKVPRSVVIRGTVDGKPWQKTVRVRRVADQAEYLPRTWAKLEIDRLVGEDAQKHRDQIISLSKAMYVMSPFTSLLVLENEEMYTQYNIDRGRKDHWALYPCPDEIKVVTEPLQPGAEDVAQTKKSTVQQLAESVKVLPEPQVVSWPNVIVVLPDGGYVYSSSSAGFQQPPHVYFGDVIRSANYGGDPGRNMDGLDARLFYSYQDTSSPMATLDLLSESEAKLTNRFLGEQGNSIDAIWLDLGMRRLQERYSKLPVLVPVEGRVPSDFAIVNAQTADGFIQLQRFDASDFYFYDQAQRFGVASAGTPSVSFVLPSPNEMLARHFWGEPSLVPNSGRMNNAWMFSAPGLQSRSELLRRRAGLRQQANLGIPQTDDLYSIVQLQDLTVDMLQTMPAQRFTVRAGQEDFGLPLVIAENVSGLEFDQPLTMTVQPWDGGTWGRNFNSAFGFEELNRNLGRRSVRLVPGSELMPLQGLANGVPEGWASLDLPFRNYSTSGRGTELSGIVPFGRSSVVEPRSAVHRWATAPQQNRRPFVSLPTFSPAVTPEFGNDRRLFGDLMSHAPGLNTSRADMLHVMTSELTNDVARAESAQANADTATGTVDPAARRLINKARAASWESVRLPGQSEDSELVIQCDGQGRYVWTRIVSEGLQERVVCDGETLLHLYDEIGLGARRTYSRFHHSTIHQLVPWLLPDIDLLARQYHITAVNDHTVALTPIVDARSQSADDTEPAEESEDDKDGKADSRRWILHLVFDQQGHLAARRLVDQESGEVLRTVEFSLDGTVRLIDAEGEVAATANWRRSPCDAADLNPDTSNLVVLPLPYRSEEAGPVVAAKSVADADLSEEDALRLMASHLASGNADAMIRIIRSRFFAKDDRRDGFYVLLSRFPEKLVWEEDVDGSDGRRQSVDLRPSAEGSPLRQFVRQWINWQLQNSDTTEFAIEGPADGFVQRLATARNLYLRWKLQTATTDRTTSQVKAELDQVLEFVDSCRTDVMGWTLLSVVEKALPHDRFGEDFAATAQRFENNPALAMWARQERVRTLFRAGRHRKARNLYRELLTNLLQSGSMPRIDAEIRTLYREHNGEPSWNKLVADIGGRILESGLPRTALMFSIQLRSLGDSEAAGWLLQQVLDSIDPAERPDVALLAIEQLRALQNNQSWDLMAAVVQVQELSEWSDLWHYAATVADEAGRKRRALDHLEHAVQLDFRNRPDVINLQSLRADYSSLLQRFEELVDASATLELPPPEELMARIIRAADQWRSIDDDDTQCCQMAARILTKLNRRDLAWAYITTPLAESSGESTQWISLAESLSGQNQWELADVAWQRAFEFEQTNPDILLRHAELLQANGQIRRSRQLLQRIIQGSWQSRFSGTVNKARQLLN